MQTEGRATHSDEESPRAPASCEDCKVGRSWIPIAFAGAPVSLVTWILLAAAALTTGCGRIGFNARSGDGGAGLGDGAHSDGVLGDGAPTECLAFAFFCDGFETGDYSRWPAKYVGSGGTLMVQTAIMHTGRYALLGSMPVGSMVGNSANVIENHAQSTGLLAVRAWVYQPQPLNGFDEVLLVYNTTNNHYLLVSGNASSIWDVSESSQAGLHDYTSTTVVPVDTWLCVELDYTFVAGAPGIDLYVDDTEVLSATGVDTAPSFNDEDLGVAHTDANGSTTIIDDVAFATQHIGCL
jgi:hypothetical protein